MTRIVVLDVETTGKDRSRDQIIEIALQLGVGDSAIAATAAVADRRVWRIKPTVPIGPEATKVHGITDADLADELPFRLVGEMVVPLLVAADVLVGYNVAFDVDMLQAELARAGMAPLDLTAKQVVDVLRLWHHVEPRTLAAAHEKFCGAPLSEAHRADADVAATAAVLGAMLGEFDLGAKPWPELAAIANPFPGRALWIGPSHHIQWSADGSAVIAFGKHNGSRLDRIDPGFLRWVLDKDFPPHVKEVCREALRLRGAELEAWIARRYPRPVATTEAA